jgi:hypothetical protein
MPQNHYSNFNVEESDAAGQTYETLAIKSRSQRAHGTP